MGDSQRGAFYRCTFWAGESDGISLEQVADCLVTFPRTAQTEHLDSSEVTLVSMTNMEEGLRFTGIPGIPFTSAASPAQSACPALTGDAAAG